MTIYIVNYSDPAKGSITVSTGTVDYSTSLGLVGHKSYDYGTVVAESFLHLLENFASSTPPANPTQGQLWYRSQQLNSTTEPAMLVYDGGKWLPTNGVYQTTTAPTSAKTGDLWVDTSSYQLKIFDGASWIIPTPGFDFTSQTGTYPELIKGTDGDDHFVIKTFLGSEVISILAKDAFTPLISINGFDNLSPGITLNSNLFDNQIAKFNGVASEAAALRVTSPATETISANNFFRKDVAQTLNNVLTLNNDAGLRIGLTNSSVVLEKINNDAVLTSTKDSSKIMFRVEKNGTRNVVLSVDGGQRGVAINKLTPDAGFALDIAGTAKISSDLTVNGAVSVSGNVTSANSIKPGMIIPMAGKTPFVLPPGWLLCNGASYSILGSYAALYDAIGTTYGGTANTFNVPNIPQMALTQGHITYIIKT